MSMNREKLDKDESLYISEVKIYFYEPSKFEQKNPKVTN